MAIRVSLDARPLSTPVSGVGRLLAETLVHFPKKNQYRFILHSHLPIHPTHEKVLKLPNIEVRIGTGFLSRKGGTYFSFYLPGELRKIQPDLFWGSQQVVPPFLPTSLPTVLTYCDLVLYLYPSTMRKIAALQQRFFQAYSVKRAKFIVSISNSTRLDLLKKFSFPENRTGVAFPGVSLEEIHSLLEGVEEIPHSLPERFLLSVSTIEPRKNYPFLLEVYRQYRNLAGGNRLPWVIVGKRGWEREEFIHELEDEIRTHKDIFLVSTASDTVLHKLYSRAEIFLFASLYEGFGIPLLEALAHQKKSLVSDIPTFHEIGGKEIPYLKTENPEEWANKISELQSNPSVPKIELEKFSWEKSAIETEKAFAFALNER